MNAFNTSVDFPFKAKCEEHTSRKSPQRKNVQWSLSFFKMDGWHSSASKPHLITPAPNKHNLSRNVESPTVGATWSSGVSTLGLEESRGPFILEREPDDVPVDRTGELDDAAEPIAST